MKFNKDRHNEDSCRYWCKIHWFYDFQTETHARYPDTFYYPLPSDTNRKVWGSAWVGVGPPAYYPKRPTNDQMTNMQAHCPHIQGDLTCNGCLRHSFHPLEI